MSGRHRLFMSEITRVGFVPAGANEDAAVVFWKARKDTDAHNDGSNVEDETPLREGTPAKEGVMDLTKITDEAVRKEVSDALAAAQAELAEAKAALAEKTPEEDPVEKADPKVQEILKAQADKIAELEKSHGAAVAKARAVDFAKRAEPLTSLLGKPDDVAPILEQLDAAAPEAYAKLEPLLVAAGKMADTSDLFKELGRGGDTEEPSQDDWVQKNRKDGETVAAARARYWVEHPDAAEEARASARGEA